MEFRVCQETQPITTQREGSQREGRGPHEARENAFMSSI